MNIMKQYLITIAYDGSRYHGWQRLTNQPETIQEIIENALSSYTSENIRINGSGRTDAGVSALAQTADFYCKCNIETTTFLQEINQSLPSDIRITSIRSIKPVSAQKAFHARKSAAEKHYRYSIALTAKGNPFTFKKVYNMTDVPIKLKESAYHNNSGSSCTDKYRLPVVQLNTHAMRKCAEYLCGTHDFTSFTTDKNMGKSHVRTINKIDITITGSIYPVLCLEFYGEGFLYNMVRILSGTILSAGLGRLNPEHIPEIINSKKRSSAGPTLPSNGLTLVSVKYDDNAFA